MLVRKIGGADADALYALKAIKPCAAAGSRRVRDEWKILSAVSHPLIVTCRYGFFATGNGNMLSSVDAPSPLQSGECCFAIVMDFVECGTLEDLLRSRRWRGTPRGCYCERVTRDAAAEIAAASVRRPWTIPF